MFYYVPNEQGALYAVTDVIDTYIYRSLKTLGDIAGSSAASATDIAEFRYNNEAVEEEENRIKSFIKEGSINPLDMKN